MILPASYSNGFAPRDGQPLYPELWRGCVFAAAPCLGPSGLTLQDWSRFSRHGTLTNMDPGTDWVTSSGKYALDFDGTNDFIDVGSRSLLSATGDWTISGWIFHRDTPFDTDAMFSQYIAVGNNGRLFLGINNSNKARLFLGSDPTLPSVNVLSSGTINTGQWCHLAATRSQSTFTLFVDGTAVASHTDAGNRQILQTGNILGAFTDSSVTYNAVPLADALFGMLDDVRIFNQVTPSRHIMTMASRRGIAYEIVPRRRSSSAVQFNRRRRLLVGAGS